MYSMSSHTSAVNIISFCSFAQVQWHYRLAPLELSVSTCRRRPWRCPWKAATRRRPSPWRGWARRCRRVGPWWGPPTARTWCPRWTLAAPPAPAEVRPWARTWARRRVGSRPWAGSRGPSTRGRAAGRRGTAPDRPRRPSEWKTRPPPAGVILYYVILKKTTTDYLLCATKFRDTVWMKWKSSLTQGNYLFLFQPKKCHNAKEVGANEILQI